MQSYKLLRTEQNKSFANYRHLPLYIWKCFFEISLWLSLNDSSAFCARLQELLHLKNKVMLKPIYLTDTSEKKKRSESNVKVNEQSRRAAPTISLSAMIAERESSHFEVVRWQSKNHTFPGMPASQAAVRHPHIAGSGRTPDPRITKKKKE